MLHFPINLSSSLQLFTIQLFSGHVLSYPINFPPAALLSLVTLSSRWRTRAPLWRRGLRRLWHTKKVSKASTPQAYRRRGGGRHLRSYALPWGGTTSWSGRSGERRTVAGARTHCSLASDDDDSGEACSVTSVPLKEKHTGGMGCAPPLYKIRPSLLPRYPLPRSRMSPNLDAPPSSSEGHSARRVGQKQGRTSG